MPCPVAAFTAITAIAATVLWDAGHAISVGSEAVPITVLTYLIASIIPIHKLVLAHPHRKPHIPIIPIVALAISLRVIHQALDGNYGLKLV